MKTFIDVFLVLRVKMNIWLKLLEGVVIGIISNTQFYISVLPLFSITKTHDNCTKSDCELFKKSFIIFKNLFRWNFFYRVLINRGRLPSLKKFKTFLWPLRDFTKRKTNQPAMKEIFGYRHTDRQTPTPYHVAP